jgi:hypothetical protein
VPSWCGSLAPCTTVFNDLFPQSDQNEIGREEETYFALVVVSVATLRNHNRESSFAGLSVDPSLQFSMSTAPEGTCPVREPLTVWPLRL